MLVHDGLMFANQVAPDGLTTSHSSTTGTIFLSLFCVAAFTQIFLFSGSLFVDYETLKRSSLLGHLGSNGHIFTGSMRRKVIFNLNCPFQQITSIYFLW